MIFKDYNFFGKNFKFLLFFAFFYQISKIKKIIFSKKFLKCLKFGKIFFLIGFYHTEASFLGLE
ncbi:hypothetical protein BKN14_01985 [Candidatus Gracilibacteria bacterium HOT-871]|nr:hypothetical protein BKN14_01985 [Candidatus Gracilibacteria bacterium HOT-871]RKW22785.1 MAG: hypothetical protein D8B46_04860 [Candidatus Gracilibacteria bacterium]